MYIVQFQNPAREPDKIFGGRVEQTFDAFMRKPMPRKRRCALGGPGRRRRRGGQDQFGVSADDRSLRCENDPRTPILSAEEKKVFVDAFSKTGFTGGINWYRNFSRNWQRSEGFDHTFASPR